MPTAQPQVDELLALKRRLETLKEKKTRTETELEQKQAQLEELKEEAKNKGLNIDTLEEDLQHSREKFLELKAQVEKEITSIEQQVKSAESQ